MDSVKRYGKMEVIRKKELKERRIRELYRDESGKLA